MQNYEWYKMLMRPTWAPPSWVFGPVWSVLYLLIAISFGKVFWMVWHKELSWWIAVPFALNLIFNFSFTWLQFGLKSNVLAGIDIVLVLATLVWALIAIFPFARWVAFINVPYLLWVMFATVLQITITVMNLGK